jgi:hypothetical protein
MGLLIPGRYGYGLEKLCRYRHLICGGDRTQFPSYSNWERAFDHVAKIATQSIHIMLCYFNGFVYRLSFCSQGQHFDIFMDNVDMVYMNIMICWNIIMVMYIYFGPAIDVCRRPIIAKPWPYNLYICQTKQSIKAYCLLFVYFYTAPNSLG